MLEEMCPTLGLVEAFFPDESDGNGVRVAAKGLLPNMLVAC